MSVVRDPAQLERRPRAVAIGTFDGVHLGHRAVIGAATELADGLTPTVVTFHPHPRAALSGNRVELLSTLQRRLELLEDLGVRDVLVVEFTRELATLTPEEFARAYLAAIGAEVVVCGSGFRFGRGRSGDLELLRTLGFETRTVPLLEGSATTGQVQALVRPENVRLTPSDEGTGRVAAVSFLGSLGRAQVTMPDETLIVAQMAASESTGLYPGAPVAVSVVPAPVFAVAD